MYYQPFRCNCYKTTQNADPLSLSFSKIKRTVSNKCLRHLRYQHRRQNAVIQTCLLAPTLGGTRKLKPGHMEFSPVSAGKTRQHKQNIQNKHQKPELARKLLVLRRRSWHYNPPPMIFDSRTISSGSAQT